MVGKGHIGFKEGLRPHERGFDYHFGFLSGARTYLPGKPDNDPIIRNGEPVTTTKPTIFLGGQGLCSTAADYERFCRMMMKRGELDGVRVLKPETVDLMFQNHLKPELGPDEIPAALFDRLDVNKDGFVTEEDAKASLQRR
jgi:CubicO group peptidase (beta-lactamase class C family)